MSLSNLKVSIVFAVVLLATLVMPSASIQAPEEFIADLMKIEAEYLEQLESINKGPNAHRLSYFMGLKIDNNFADNAIAKLKRYPAVLNNYAQLLKFYYQDYVMLVRRTSQKIENSSRKFEDFDKIIRGQERHSEVEMDSEMLTFLVQMYQDVKLNPYDQSKWRCLEPFERQLKAMNEAPPPGYYGPN